MDASIAASEAVSSTTAAGTATACVECLVSYGMDPTVAAAVAVLLGVFARLFVDWAQRRLAARSDDDGPPDDEPPTGASPALVLITPQEAAS